MLREAPSMSRAFKAVIRLLAYLLSMVLQRFLESRLVRGGDTAGIILPDVNAVEAGFEGNTGGGAHLGRRYVVCIRLEVYFDTVTENDAPKLTCPRQCGA